MSHSQRLSLLPTARSIVQGALEDVVGDVVLGPAREQVKHFSHLREAYGDHGAMALRTIEKNKPYIAAMAGLLVDLGLAFQSEEERTAAAWVLEKAGLGSAGAEKVLQVAAHIIDEKRDALAALSDVANQVTTAGSPIATLADATVLVDQALAKLILRRGINRVVFDADNAYLKEKGLPLKRANSENRQAIIAAVADFFTVHGLDFSAPEKQAGALSILENLGLRASDRVLKLVHELHTNFKLLGVAVNRSEEPTEEPAPLAALTKKIWFDAADDLGSWIDLAVLGNNISRKSLHAVLEVLHSGTPAAAFVEKFGEQIVSDIFAHWDLSRTGKRPLTQVRLVLSNDNAQCTVHMRNPTGEQHHVLNKTYTDEK